MVKAKFGALALTVLMGLGAVSPLHGVTEAHALNAPVANSAQQKTVVSTTDDSDGVMSYKDKESGKTFVSEDNGARYVKEFEYINMFKRKPEAKQYFRLIQWPNSQAYFELPSEKQRQFEPILYDVLTRHALIPLFISKILYTILL